MGRREKSLLCDPIPDLSYNQWEVEIKRRANINKSDEGGKGGEQQQELKLYF